MIRKSVFLIALVTVLSAPLLAGTVLEMSAKNESGQQWVVDRIQAQAGKLRFDHLDEAGNPLTTMIFQNDQMIVVSHKDRKFHRIDEATLARLKARMSEASAAMQKMKEQMANMPPQQRAMMEKMMGGKMPGMPNVQAQTPSLRVEAAGQGSWESYSCKNYVVYRESEKTQELCAAPPNEIEGGDEVLQAMRNMADFHEKLQAGLEQIPFFSSLASNPVETMSQVDGFPVHTRDYENGVLQAERFLSSASEETLSDAIFSPPQGYSEQEISGM